MAQTINLKDCKTILSGNERYFYRETEDGAKHLVAKQLFNSKYFFVFPDGIRVVEQGDTVRIIVD